MAHGGNIWEAALGSLDFSADLNPSGPPPGLEMVLKERWADVAVYPEPGYRLLREALARKEGMHPSCILPGNGTAELIHLISRWKKAARATVCVPTFTEYERAVAADGGEVLPVILRPEEEFLPGAPPRADKTDLLFLCNPNNPTGRLWPKERLLEWLYAYGRSGATVVLDEAYMDFVRDGLRESAVQWLDQFPSLIILRSLTKSFAVPGLRLGYLVASPLIIEQLKKIQPPWTVSAPAVAAGIWLADQQKVFEAYRNESLAARDALAEQLRLIPGIRSVPSEANFFLLQLADPVWTGSRLAARLAERGILVRVCDDFTGLEPGRYVRVAVRKPEENRQLVSALKETLNAG